MLFADGAMTDADGNVSFSAILPVLANLIRLGFAADILHIHELRDLDRWS